MKKKEICRDQVTNKLNVVIVSTFVDERSATKSELVDIAPTAKKERKSEFFNLRQYSL